MAASSANPMDKYNELDKSDFEKGGIFEKYSDENMYDFWVAQDALRAMQDQAMRSYKSYPVFPYLDFYQEYSIDAFRPLPSNPAQSTSIHPDSSNPFQAHAIHFHPFPPLQQCAICNM